MDSAMDADVFDQARRLHGTIRDLQQRLTVRSLRPDTGLGNAPRELTLAQITTLTVLHERGTMNLKDLAEATHVSPPSASAMIDRLSDFHLVQRETSAADRREVRISLTPAGTEAVEHFERALLNSLVDLLQKIGPDSAQQWCEVYEQVQGVLDTEPAITLRLTAAG